MIIQGKVWGHTTPLFNKNNVELHIAQIKKDGFCSKHLHKFKFNRFIVLKGKLKVTIWKNYGTEVLEDVSILEHSQECTVAPGDYHKFEALEDTTVLEVYWVELNETDIVRLDHGGIYCEKKADTGAEPEVNRVTSANAKSHLYSTDYSTGSHYAKERDDPRCVSPSEEELYGRKHFGNNNEGQTKS